MSHATELQRKGKDKEILHCMICGVELKTEEEIISRNLRTNAVIRKKFTQFCPEDPEHFSSEWEIVYE